MTAFCGLCGAQADSLWWTLGDLRAAVDGAGFGDEPLGRIKEKLEEVQPKKLVIGGVEMDPETPEDALLKKARDKLDEVCAGDGADWDGAREYLAFLFREAGRTGDKGGGAEEG